MIISNEDLDRWSEIYLSNNIAARLPGMTLTIFLENPEEILKAAIYKTPAPLPDGEDFYPLLPKQINAALDAIEQEKEQALIETLEDGLVEFYMQLRGDRLVEPLKHHSYATSHDRRMRSL